MGRPAIKPITCLHCGRVLYEKVLGIALPVLKANILRAIKATGREGMSSEEIGRQLYEKPASRHTIKAHVWQINELLAETDYRIVSDRRRWYLEKHAQ